MLSRIYCDNNSYNCNNNDGIKINNNDQQELIIKGLYKIREMKV